MEFIIDEKSKIACANHIIKHIRKDTSNNSLTNTGYILQVMKKYNYPILQELFPYVLANIIIKYINEKININVMVSATYYQHIMISVTNEELNIKFNHYMNIINSKINICQLYIDHIYVHHKTACECPNHDDYCFINYYMAKYHPNKEQLIKYRNINHDTNNYHHDMMFVDSHINHEQLDNELTIMIALFNNLHNVII